MLKKFNEKSVKGENSTNLIIGGSEIYTGAPYFASLASLRSGSDLSYIMTQSDAILPLKILIPEAMVVEISKVSWILNRVNVCIVGSGLGRLENTIENEILGILEYLDQRKIPLIFDGDGISFFVKYYSIFKNYNCTILTPNKNELKKVKTLGDITDLIVVKKGEVDVVNFKGNITVINDENSLKRCGGQGDILVGILCTLISNNECENLEECIVFGCRVLRRATLLAYKMRGGSLITSDIFDYIQKAMSDIDSNNQ